MGEMVDFINNNMFADDEYDLALVRCRYCNRDGFYWRETEAGWRLTTPTGKIHICSAYKKAGWTTVCGRREK